MITMIKGDLFFVKSGVIAHGCNAMGVMGSGVAKTMRELYPVAFSTYKMYVENSKLQGKNVLGTINPVRIDDQLTIVNLITQSSFGRNSNIRYVSYDAVDDCMKSLGLFMIETLQTQRKRVSLNMPKIGAGLGNGDWDVIKSIIKDRIDNVIDLDINIYFQ